MEPLIRLHEYCETALMEALSTARLLPVPEAGHSLPKLRTLTSAALRFANVGAPAPERGFLHGLSPVESREGN